MLNRLYQYQKSTISKKLNKFIKSIDSGLFTGIRNNDGSIKELYIKHANTYLIKYNFYLKTINMINNSFVKKYNFTDTIKLYRGINAKLDDKYIDKIPTSFTFNKNKAFDFILDNGILLEYNCQNLNDMIINISDDDVLNEYEVILPPNKYNIIKKINNIEYNCKKYDYNIKYNKYIIEKI